MSLLPFAAAAAPASLSAPFDGLAISSAELTPRSNHSCAARGFCRFGTEETTQSAPAFVLPPESLQTAPPAFPSTQSRVLLDRLKPPRSLPHTFGWSSPFGRALLPRESRLGCYDSLAGRTYSGKSQR